MFGGRLEVEDGLRRWVADSEAVVVATVYDREGNVLSVSQIKSESSGVVVTDSEGNLTMGAASVKELPVGFLSREIVARCFNAACACPRSACESI